MKQYKRVRGFVRNKTTGHVSFAFWQNQKNVKSLGFTHNGDDKADKIELKHNIDPNDTTKCYVKTTVEKQPCTKYRYESRYSNYRVHKDDRFTIDEITNKKRRH